MKSLAKLTFMTATTALVIWVAVNPQSGLVFQSPTAAIGVGLIGLGLMKNAMHKPKPQAAKATSR